MRESEILKVFSMKDRVVIITGGTGFLGRQYANILNQAGAIVVIFDCSPRTTLEECRKTISYVSGKNLLAMQVDVTNKDQIKDAVTRVYKKTGRIDVLVNNAAMNPAVDSEEMKKMFAPYENYPSEIWDKEIAVDLTGAQFCTQVVAPYMMKQRTGVIVNVSSAVANAPVDNSIYGEGKFKSVAYIVTKTGILGLTRAWASYLGKYNVRVNAFSPGGMPKAEVSEGFRKRYSSLNMLGRMAEIDEYNGAMLFLCSDASSFMTGSQLAMDGGISSC